MFTDRWRMSMCKLDAPLLVHGHPPSVGKNVTSPLQSRTGSRSLLDYSVISPVSLRKITVKISLVTCHRQKYG